MGFTAAARFGVVMTLAALVVMACGSSDDTAAAGGTSTDAGVDGSGPNPADAQAEASSDGGGGVAVCSTWPTPALIEDPPAFEPVPDHPSNAINPMPQWLSVAIDDAGTAYATWSTWRAGTYCGGSYYAIAYASRRPLGGAWSMPVIISGDGPARGGNELGQITPRSQIVLNPDGNGFIATQLHNYCDSSIAGRRSGISVTKISPSGIGASSEVVYFAYPSYPDLLGTATQDQDGNTLEMYSPFTLAMGPDGSAVLAFGARQFPGPNVGANFVVRFDPVKNAWDQKATRLTPLQPPNPAIDGVTFPAGAAHTYNAVAAGPGGSFLVAWMSGAGKTLASWYTPATGWTAAAELGDGFVCGDCRFRGANGNPIDVFVDADGSAFVAWRKQETYVSSADPILVAHYTKAGGWEAPLIVPPGLPRGAKPSGFKLARGGANGGMTLTWQEFAEIPPGDVTPWIQLQRSELSGGAWSGPTLITKAVADPLCMATDDTGKALIAYRGFEPGVASLNTRVFTPGVGWSAPTTIVNPSVSRPDLIRLLQTDEGVASGTPGQCAAFNHAGQSVVAWGQVTPPPPQPPNGDSKHQVWATTCP